MKNVEKNLVVDADTVRNIRKIRRESQTKFWKRFGVTQSRGSRFEMGTEIPTAINLLIKLFIEGRVKEGDLL